jgi:hypothetical protein
LDSVVRSIPFPHIVIASVFSDEMIRRILETLESAHWESRSSDFYRFEVPDDSRLDRENLLRSVMGAIPFHETLGEFERAFTCRLHDDVRLEIHRYGEGSGIGPHTDFGSREVRWVMNINREWNIESGRVWILSADSTLRNRVSYLPAISNTGFVFPSRDDSYHALSTCLGSVTYGLTFRLSRF